MYKVLQYSPNSRFSVQHSSRENIHFRPSQGYKAQGPLQQSPGQQEVSSPPPEPWGGWSQFLAIFGLGYLVGPGEGPGDPGISWHLLGHSGMLLDHAGDPGACTHLENTVLKEDGLSCFLGPLSSHFVILV